MKCFMTIATFVVLGSGASAAHSQALAQQAQAPQAAAPPATKIEAFKPAAGSVLTIGYDELGAVAGISVDVREMRDQRNVPVRGLVVEIHESQYREERSFVDADEVPELLKGFDSLLEIRENPTQFKSFEVRYTTRGELQLTAFNSSNGAIAYAVQAGRTLKAQRLGLSAADMQKIRALFVAASQKLQALSSAR